MKRRNTLFKILKSVSVYKLITLFIYTFLNFMLKKISYKLDHQVDTKRKNNNF